MNPSLKNVIRWLSTVIQYIISTICLSAGLATSLSIAAAASNDGYTLNKSVAGVIGLLLGIVIQWLETDHVLHPDEADDFESWFVPGLIIVDGLMIFIALGGHLNIIWMITNYRDPAGMVVHIVGLFGQLIGAIIGAYNAEKSLAKTMDIKPASAHSNHDDQDITPPHDDQDITPPKPQADEDNAVWPDGKKIKPNLAFHRFEPDHDKVHVLIFPKASAAGSNPVGWCLVSEMPSGNPPPSHKTEH